MPKKKTATASTAPKKRTKPTTQAMPTPATAAVAESTPPVKKTVIELTVEDALILAESVNYKKFRQDMADFIELHGMVAAANEELGDSRHPGIKPRILAFMKEEGIDILTLDGVKVKKQPGKVSKLDVQELLKQGVTLTQIKAATKTTEYEKLVVGVDEGEEVTSPV